MSRQHPIFRHMQADGRGHGGSADGGPGASSGEEGGFDEPKLDVNALLAGHAGRAEVSGVSDWPDNQRNTEPSSSVFDQALPPDGPMNSRPGRLRRALARLMAKPKPTTPRPTAGPEGPAKGVSPKHREKLVRAMQAQLLRAESRDRLISRAGKATPNKLMDVLVASVGEPKLPDEVFPRLRWGGLFAYIAPNEKSVRNLAEAFDNKRGFVIQQQPTAVHANAMGLRIPGITPSGWAFTARKTQLIQPGDTTERFTYHVELSPCDVGPDTPHGYLVSKSVPSYENLLWRLRQKFPEVDLEDLKKRAHKLVDHVFPTFLTREAAILGILQTNLAPEYRHRVPKPLAIEKDARGFVRTLHMNWMRVGGEAISQLQFAAQSAELLTALHEQARVMHLDLRMDNMVITPDGVGFVDFGSACRIGEQLNQSPMLNTLFTEMMRTSQIQRMLGKMIERGHVTNNAISEVYGKVDKTVDSFYLAVQITKPHGNPELRQLIDFDPESNASKMLSALTAAVLRPKNPEMAHYKTARDVLRGIRRIERRVGHQPANA